MTIATHDDAVSRRAFLNLVGGSIALAGTTACTRQPRETIYARGRRPEEALPGESLFYATALPYATGALGLLVETNEGRPVKVEGNPDHPASLGATDPTAQAALLDLYDPHRSQTVLDRGRISSWVAFQDALVQSLERLPGGEGLVVLSRAVTSPTLDAQRAVLLRALPGARWLAWESVHRDAERAAAIAAFGEDLTPRPDLSRADAVLCLDLDLLSGPEGVRHALAFAARRRLPNGHAPHAHPMPRLFAVEPRPTITGARADHRLARSPRAIEDLLEHLAAAVGVEGALPQRASGADAAWGRAAGKELALRGDRALVLAGRSLSVRAQALAHAMNRALGAVGGTVAYGEPVALAPRPSVQSVTELARAARAGQVRVLIVLGGNPLYDAPPELGLADAFGAVPMRVHLGSHVDETAERCHWHLPEAHPFEAWSDARAFDGSASIVQPLISPLYGGRSAHEVLSMLAGESRSGHEIVRSHWSGRIDAEGVDGDAASEHAWRRALHAGLVPGSAAAARAPDALGAGELPPRPRAGGERELVLVLHPDEHVGDGRAAGNAWLQELPRPMTQLTWDNALLLAPPTAARLGVSTDDIVVVRAASGSIRAAVLVQQGMAKGCAALALGYGRRGAGLLEQRVGFDAGPIRSGGAWVLDVAVERTGESYRLALAQQHGSMEGRDLARRVTLESLRAGAAATASTEAGPRPTHGPTPSQHPPHDEDAHQWGMTIDLGSCIGCGACTIACQAENNIPPVGKQEVALGRELHWIRVDRYLDGDPHEPDVRFQPVPCMHCENAPCELVCPVGATVHGPEGLNEMVYNRCVGTRYCSNNCPYKVRRFNFHQYADFRSDVGKLMRNPEVTVRTRGVMEKCTYCVQRIQRARIDARRAGRPIEDGAIVTACQQVCPARAITFGDIADEETEVARKRAQPHHYALLSELNTRPRTTYLSDLTNPLPSLPAVELDADDDAVEER